MADQHAGLSGREVREKLETRGIELNPGVPSSELDRWEARLGTKIDSVWRQMYGAFNGFQGLVMDTRTAICIWPIEQVHEEAANYRGAGGRLPFADYLLHSDFLMGDLSAARNPIYYEYEGEIISASLTGFLQKLVTGGLDRITD